MTAMARISAAAIRITPGMVTGAVPPALGRLQAWIGTRSRPHWMIASTSIDLNSSGVKDVTMQLTIGRARRAASPPAATAAMRSKYSVFSSP